MTRLWRWRALYALLTCTSHCVLLSMLDCSLKAIAEDSEIHTTKT